MVQQPVFQIGIAHFHGQGGIPDNEDRRNLLSHDGSEEKKIFPSILKNLLCSIS